MLQAIRIAGETTRIELARETGLTPPAIASITSRLTDMGLVRVAGRRQGGRGQPALKLQIDREGAYGIGLNIDRDHLTLVVVDLSGEVRCRVTREFSFAMPDDVTKFIQDELEQALQSAVVNRERILGVGVAVPDDLGQIQLPDQPAGYEIWDTVKLNELLSFLPWPIHTDNDAAAAALGEAHYGAALKNPTFFYILVSAGLGGGLVVDRIYHRGATARSGEIGLMPDPRASAPGATVQDTVSLSALLHRLRAGTGREVGPDFLANPNPLTESDPLTSYIVNLWLEDCVATLRTPLTAINCLLDPDAVLIGGRLPLPLIEELARRMTKCLSEISLPARAEIRLAEMAQDAAAIGAAILPFLDHLLPSDSVLIHAAG